MVLYNFKQIPVVPSASDFIDIVLSRTQRQTPTVCHGGWKISRIRQFYMRKVKHTQTTWHDGLGKILEAFPQIQSVHPFYRNLLNVLYDHDHYKLALGQLNVARNLIDKLGQDYVRLLKYGDTQYRCKQLKRAALGRMATIMKKQGPGLKYLEQVRQHMSRLPSIDPNTRTILLCGCPNVGKSSFMNLVTRADVEVEPYAFTTKSLYVGHMDYKYLRWQVIDTPGLLDRPLEDRNTIEMQSVTALAHLNATVLFIVDISEQCGYSIVQQAALFRSLRSGFLEKPVLVCCNKTDVRPLAALTPEERGELESIAAEAIRLEGASEFMEEDTVGALMTMSTMTEEGVMPIKHAACERLLRRRVDAKLRGHRTDNILNRLHVAMPKGGMDPARPPCIPERVLAARARATLKTEEGEEIEEKMTEKQIQEAMGGGGVYCSDDRRSYLLQDPDWKYDIMPEIWDGHNILDFVDPDIDLKLRELEMEEAEYESQMLEDCGVEGEALTLEELQLLEKIRRQKKLSRDRSIREKSARTNNPIVARRNKQRSLDQMAEKLEALGMDPSNVVERVRSESRRPRRRGRSAEGEMEIDEAETKRVHSSKSRSLSRGRSVSLAEPVRGSGLMDGKQRNKAVKLADRSQRRRNKQARRGEGDRHIPALKPKHLFTGIRGIGKTIRR